MFDATIAEQLRADRFNDEQKTAASDIGNEKSGEQGKGGRKEK